MTIDCRPEAKSEGRNLAFTSPAQRADLAFDAADAEASGNDDAVHVRRAASAPSIVSHTSAATHLTLALA
jgi:hypothetical protein